MVDGSVRFINDFVESGPIQGGSMIEMADTNPLVFLTWQRLNVSKDGYSIASEF